jgi:predicted ATP-grasp superfamily ATP-dependent carboligase
MNILILGRNHYNAYGLIRSLGEKKHKIFLILWQESNDWMTKSKYIENITRVSTYDDVKAAIVSISSTLSDKPVLLVTSDEDADFVDANHSLLNRYCITEGGKFDGAMKPYRSKEKMNELASELGLTLPRTWELADKTALPADLSYPVLVKAVESFGNWKSAMKRCDSEQELKAHLSGVSDKFFPLIAQEFIEKEYELLLLGCAKDDEVCIPVGHKKIRFYPHQYSASCYSLSVEVASDTIIAAIAEKIKNFVRKIGYTGMFSAELLFAQGKYYFLEVNLRNDATNIVSTRCGYNLPDLLCRWLKNEHVDMGSFRYKRADYINPYLDAHSLLAGNVPVFTWLKQMTHVGANNLFDRRDMMPFISFCSNIIRRK